MTEIVHLSDLHFGTEDPAVVAGLISSIAETAPALVVVSGDLTQRAIPAEFVAARRCLEHIGVPQLVVPGNHDQPLWNLVRRVVDPLGGYRRWISTELEPRVDFPDAVVLGIDTACRWVWKRGRVRAGHVKAIDRAFRHCTEERLLVLVSHHPLLPADASPGQAPEVYGRLRPAIALLRRCGPSLLLAGHLHQGDTGGIHAADSGSILAIQAGTATSRRLRNQPNAFNRIQIDNSRVIVTVRQWTGKAFEDMECRSYLRGRRIWTRIE